MNTEVLHPSFEGIIPPVATPLSDIDALDAAGLERLVEHILAGGVHALFLLGTTGEGPALSYRLRREVIQRTCEQVAGRVPVLVGVTDTSPTETLRMIDCAAEVGAAAAVVAPPFYFPLTQMDMLRLIEDLAQRSPLPLLLYNQPQLTKLSFSPETVEVAAEISNVVGLKDSSGDMQYLRAVLRRVQRVPQFKVLVGAEHLLVEALDSGAHGGVPGGANIFPHLPVKLYEAWKAGRRELAVEIQKQIVTFGDPIWNSGEAGLAHLRRLKCALNVLGLCSARPAWPCIESSVEERSLITEHLRSCGILS